ncbi:MAG: hypothetical protein U5L72_12530 [Bacteroidales bacterium]|nr:hypothetical protein [Bacteroidales bacterium]
MTDSDREKTTGKGFPGLWNMTGNTIKITQGSFRTGAYNNDAPGHTDKPHFQVAALDVTLDDVMLSGEESGFRMDRLSFALENGFLLENGEMDFSSGSDLKSRVRAKLKSASSRVNLEIEIGNKLAAPG